MLHLGAPRLGDGLAEEGDMSPTDLVGLFGGESRRRRGGAHDVGEKNGDVLGGHKPGAAASTLVSVDDGWGHDPGCGSDPPPR